MQLLQKRVEDGKDKRKDNADKKNLLPKELHPHTANFYKDEWSFIKNQEIRENIAYHLQYLEFLVSLYNEYQVYLTIESLLCKTILITVGSVVECALADLLDMTIPGTSSRTLQGGAKKDFLIFIDIAYRQGLIDRELQEYFHDLRKLRNRIHLSETTFQEYKAYTVPQANQYLGALERLRESAKIFSKKSD